MDQPPKGLIFPIPSVRLGYIKKKHKNKIPKSIKK
jgi:hypothetical protein